VRSKYSQPLYHEVAKEAFKALRAYTALMEKQAAHVLWSTGLTACEVTEEPDKDVALLGVLP